MARNTDIDRIIFPVREQPVFLKDKATAIPGLKAITGLVNLHLQVFSVVSSEYQLVTNAEALDLGKIIHQKLFPNANANSFEIFNVITPKTGSFCHIDIIDANYTKNIWKTEMYVPFIRIHNSYNRSRSLRFDIGFCRKLCDNGVIFEQEVVKLKFSHTRKEIDFSSLSNLDVSHLKKLENDFISKTRKAAEIQIPLKLFVPLAAKVLNKSFNINSKHNPTREREIQKMKAFQDWIGAHIKKYQDEFGNTAYTLFNVITDYASNHAGNHVNAINGMQRKAGLWINSLGAIMEKPGFNWHQEIKEQQYFLN